jgi:hypothetical protein
MAATWDDRANEQPTRRFAKSRLLHFRRIARQSVCYDSSNNYRARADSEWIEPLPSSESAAGELSKASVAVWGSA